LIVDATAVVAAFASSDVEALFSNAELFGPDLVVVETLNAFWKLARVGMSVPKRPEIFALLDKMHIVPSRPFASRAAEIAEKLDHPIYDCLYLAMAEANSDILLTADRRLERKLAKSPLRKLVRTFGAPASR